jgi:hypothetical protein
VASAGTIRRGEAEREGEGGATLTSASPSLTTILMCLPSCVSSITQLLGTTPWLLDARPASSSAGMSAGSMSLASLAPSTSAFPPVTPPRPGSMHLSV